MNRERKGGREGVVLDVCWGHGTWFDPGELQHMVMLLRSGYSLAPTARGAMPGPMGLPGCAALLPYAFASSESGRLRDVLDGFNALGFLWDVVTAVVEFLQ